MYKKYIPLIISVLLAVVGFIVLPDSCAVQLNSGGVSNHMPKAFAVLLPLLLTVAGYVSGRNTTEKIKPVILIVVGIICQVFTLVINL